MKIVVGFFNLFFVPQSDRQILEIETSHSSEMSMGSCRELLFSLGYFSCGPVHQTGESVCCTGILVKALVILTGGYSTRGTHHFAVASDT